MKSYINRLPSDVEHEKLQQSYRILEGQLKQSEQTLIDYRKDKQQLKKQLVTYQKTLDEQREQIKAAERCSEPAMFNAKCLSIDERIETDKKFTELNRTIQELNEKLNDERLQRQHDHRLNESNIRTVESLSNAIAKSEQTIREMTALLRQVRIFSQFDRFYD